MHPCTVCNIIGHLTPIVGESTQNIDDSVEDTTEVRNLEDMLFAAYCNGALAPDEMAIVVAQARVLGIEKEQLTVIKSEAKQRFDAFR